MERTKHSPKLVTLGSDLVNRLTLAASLGMQTFNGERDIFQILGYPNNITYKMYYDRYKRQDIAYAVIDKPITATWRGDIPLSEQDSIDETPLEKEFALLDEEFKLKSIFMRADSLTSIGQYGIMLLGLDDVKKLEDFSKPVSSGKRKLLYVKPYGEGSVDITKTETKTSSKRYGMPELYKIEGANLIQGDGSTVSNTSITVHHTRIIHIVQGSLESETIGTPVLEAVFNILINIEKIIGGDAEMFWKGARPGYQGKVDKDYQMTPTTKTDLENQLDEFEHNLRRVLVNDGVDFTSLAQQIADPTAHLDVQIQMVSAKTHIPKRILVGSERGELSSTQDKDSWDTYITSRRQDFAQVQIVNQFVDRCIEYKILPATTTKKYTIVWEDLFAPSEKSKAEVGKIRASALKEYVTMPAAEMVVKPSAFMEYFLGLSKDQITHINQLGSSEELDESAIIAEMSRVENDPTPIVETKPKAKKTDV